MLRSRFVSRFSFFFGSLSCRLREKERENGLPVSSEKRRAVPCASQRSFLPLLFFFLAHRDGSRLPTGEIEARARGTRMYRGRFGNASEMCALYVRVVTFREKRELGYP